MATIYPLDKKDFTVKTLSAPAQAKAEPFVQLLNELFEALDFKAVQKLAIQYAEDFVITMHQEKVGIGCHINSDMIIVINRK